MTLMHSICITVLKVCKYTKCLVNVLPPQSAEPALYPLTALLSFMWIHLWHAQHVMAASVHSETEMTYSLQILLELEMNMKGSGANPFASLKPEVVGSCLNKPPVYCNSHYFCFQGLLETVEFEEPEEAWKSWNSFFIFLFSFWGLWSIVFTGSFFNSLWSLVIIF